MINNIAIIIPTYNARNSIVKTIKNVFKYLPKSKLIIVDDNSPDKTAEEVSKHYISDKRIKLIIRNTKGGRGSAVLMGFQEALKDKNIEILIEMDADLCHNPKYIPIMINRCRIHDVTIASKYLKKSKIYGLSIKRKIFSRIVNLYIRLMLQIPITDFTNGFRCYKRKALEGINFNSFFSKGFIVLSEIVYRIYKNGGTFREIPFEFIQKEINKSNFNLKEVKEGFFVILKLRYNFK